ncbi:hypothetical protein [Pollutibacter soli]|uniref:hypothetical protein n=1 Tax=Pollutibacter soli TaxID=3034157 RepID=UPI003013F5A7
MKASATFLLAVILFSSCQTTKRGSGLGELNFPAGDTLITQSLFNDKSSTVSEENIQKILDGTYALPQQLRVAVVRLDPGIQQRRNYGYFFDDEQYLKTQQSYLDLFIEKFKQSPRVNKVTLIPDLLVSKSPNFTNIREAAVRMQADIVVIYAITSDLYSKYKVFSKTDIKAFATTQLIVLDVRTGLVPFSTIVTKDAFSQRKKEELDITEAAGRVQHEAVLLTINDIGSKITSFLGQSSVALSKPTETATLQTNGK